MDDDLTPAWVEGEIIRLSGVLDKATTETAKRATVAAENRVTFKVAQARAFLEAEGSVEARKASATIETEAVMLASELADARLLGAQDAARNMRAQLDALRSVNANVRHLAAL